MKELFEDLNTLETWYNEGIINLDYYLKIKSNIVDYHRKNAYSENGELPF